MLGKNKGKQLTVYVPDYVVFDLETTGVSCYRDSVVEISAIKVIGGMNFKKGKDYLQKAQTR